MTKRSLAAAAAALLWLGLTPRLEAARLGTDVMPLAEELELDLDPRAADYTGTARIDLEARREATSFALHARDLTLLEVSLLQDGRPLPVRHRGEGDEGLLVVTPEAPLAPGRYRLVIRFRNDFGTKAVALYKVVKDGLAYSFTDFEPADAREAFPCFDEPAFKVPWRLIVRIPEDSLAVANAPVEFEAREGGRKTVRFAATPPLPSYLVALATGPLETRPIPGLERLQARVVAVRGQTGLAGLATEVTPPLLASLERWFGQPYPFAKLDLIAVPEFWPGAMENPGAITFAEGVLLVPSQPTLSQRRRLAVVVAHELAHMWFGDLVTMTWWDDLWLNESFADWMAERTMEEVFPELGFGLAQRIRVESTMSSDARASAEPVRRPIERVADGLSGVRLAYDKGNSVLGMFEGWMGAERFRNGVRAHLEEHAWGSASADDLWRALTTAAGSDVGAAMATFLDQPGLPLVRVEREREREGAAGGVRLTQSRFAPEGVALAAKSWRIPVVLKYQAGGATHTQAVLLDRDSHRFELAHAGGGIDWLLPNAEANGYYRWVLPGAELAQLAAAAGDRLTPVERIAFLGNLAALLEAGKVEGPDYLRLLERFAGDPEPQVVGALMDGLEKVRDAFVTVELDAIYAAYLRQTLGPTLTRIGIERRAGEAEDLSLLRPRLLGWLGDEGRDTAVRSYAAAAARRYLDEPGALDPAVAETILALAALDGDRPLFDAYRRRFEAARVPADRSRFLSALGHFRAPDLAEEALAYALSGPLRPNEVFTIPRSLPDDSRGRDRYWRWVTASYPKIVERLPATMLGMLPFAAAGCELERLEEATAFFADPGRQSDGVERSLRRVGDSVRDCVRLREREGKAVAGYLRQAVAGAASAEAERRP